MNLTIQILKVLVDGEVIAVEPTHDEEDLVYISISKELTSRLDTDVFDALFDMMESCGESDYDDRINGWLDKEGLSNWQDENGRVTLEYDTVDLSGYLRDINTNED